MGEGGKREKCRLSVTVTTLLSLLLSAVTVMFPCHSLQKGKWGSKKGRVACHDYYGRITVTRGTRSFAARLFVQMYLCPSSLFCEQSDDFINKDMSSNMVRARTHNVYFNH